MRPVANAALLHNLGIPVARGWWAPSLHAMIGALRGPGSAGPAVQGNRDAHGIGTGFGRLALPRWRGVEPCCLAWDQDVTPLWCLLLAGAQVVPAITPAQVDVQTPRQGLRLPLAEAQDHWAQFEAYVRRHPSTIACPPSGCAWMRWPRSRPRRGAQGAGRVVVAAGRPGCGFRALRCQHRFAYRLLEMECGHPPASVAGRHRRFARRHPGAGLRGPRRVGAGVRPGDAGPPLVPGPGLYRGFQRAARAFRWVGGVGRCQAAGG